MIKSKITNIKSSPSYPYIGETLSTDKKKSILVLFTSKNTGVCIYNDIGDCCTNVGDNVNFWEEDKFKKYEGSITLEND